ncbi:unnamed protein product [Colias eurytheme]|nr:unnamed protein product [Colias eurytheme]
MASTCIHDSRMVCATSQDGCTRRSFLDQCDMYEYNCDYGTQYMTKVNSQCTTGYQETYILFCASYYMGLSTFTSKELPKTTTYNDSIKNETQILNKTVTNMTDSTCNETKPDHKTNTTDSSKEDNAKSTEQFTNVTQRYTSSAYGKSNYTISAHTITKPVLIKKNEKFHENDCKEEVSTKSEIDALHHMKSTTETNMDDEEIEILSETDEEKLKLDLKVTKKAHTHEHGIGSHCGRPSTWATTKKGETRDFFRVLKDRIVINY